MKRKSTSRIFLVLFVLLIPLLFSAIATAQTEGISVKIKDPDTGDPMQGIYVGAVKVSEITESDFTLMETSDDPKESAERLFWRMVEKGIESDILQTGKDGVCLFDAENEAYLIYCPKDQEIRFSPFVVTLSANNASVLSSPKTERPPRPQDNISVRVTKLWDDGMNKDGMRPKAVTVSLLKDGVPYKKAVLSEANLWKHTFTGLSKRYSYSVLEEEVENYTPAYSGNSSIGYTIINKYTKEPAPKDPETRYADITVRKIWNDEDNKDGARPESITVQLITGTEIISTASLRQESGWTYTFTKLDKNKAYTVKEIMPSGYSAEYLGDATSGFVITNTKDERTDPGIIPDPSYPDDPVKTDVFVKVEWIDDNNSYGKRPENVTVHLISDGSICQTGIIDPLAEWEHTFGNVDINKAYTVLEETVEGYTTTYSGNARDGFLITNIYSETTVPGTSPDPSFPDDPNVTPPVDPTKPIEPQIPQTGHKTAILYILMTVGAFAVITGLVLSLKGIKARLLVILGFVPVIISTAMFISYDKEDITAGQNASLLLNNVRATIPPPSLANDIVINESSSGELPSEEHLGYSVSGVIEIPSIGAELPVQADWSYPLLKISPCRYSGSVEEGNLIILGHNYKRHFGDLKNCNVGDSVAFTDINGRVHNYTVSSLSVLDAKALDELTTTDSELTIFTCTDNGEKRYVLRCEAEMPINDKIE